MHRHRPLLPTRTLLIGTLLLAVVLAGCLGGDDAVVQDDGDDGNGPAQVSETTGAIEAEVMDASSLDPLEGATVNVVLDGRLVKDGRTDKHGQVAISGLEPATYQVQVTTITHQSMVRGAAVKAGEVSRVSFLLEPFSSDLPFSELLEFDGHMAFGTANPAFLMTAPLADPNHQVVFNFDVDPQLLETIVVELRWSDTSVGMRADLWLNPNCSPCNPDHEYDSETGFGEIQLRADHKGGEWPKLEGETDEITVQVWADNADELATLAYQHQFTVLIELFYVSPAPSDYVIHDNL